MRLLLATTLLCLSSALPAQGLYQTDFNALLYLRAPFGETAKPSPDDGLTFGFSVNHSRAAVTPTGGMNLMSERTRHQRLAAVEWSTGSGYFSTFNVGGVDALEYQTVLHADGSSTQWPMGLKTSHIVLGAMVAAGVGIGIAVSDDDDDDDEEQQQGGGFGGGF